MQPTNPLPMAPASAKLWENPLRPDRAGPASVAYFPAREILTRATGFMSSYDFTLNPYSGCSFACSYCYAAFFSQNESQRENWGYWVRVKENAADLLAQYPPGALDGKRIYLSSVTDPYQPVERKLGLTRQLLEILAQRHRPKLVVQTRSPDVVRDCDLFRQIEDNGGRVQVNLTVTTDDEEFRRAFEPSCPATAARLQAASKTQAADVNVCITMTPLLLVQDPPGFAGRLAATGARRFIIQPFHFAPGRNQFVAQTRDQALELMAEKLECPPANFKQRYLEHYRQAGAILRETLNRPGFTLGEGREGFRPPF